MGNPAQANCWQLDGYAAQQACSDQESRIRQQEFQIRTIEDQMRNEQWQRTLTPSSNYYSPNYGY